MLKFSIQSQLPTNLARTGLLRTPHGVIETPAFVPVGTQATVKGVSGDELNAVHTQVLFANTYHLHLRPGEQVIKKSGGLHHFMNWFKPIMTDSGGFQAFSLGFGIEHGVGKIANIFPDESSSKTSRLTASQSSASSQDASAPRKKLTTITEDGVTFQSHLDGARLMLTPELSMKIQNDLGADLIMAFDECTSPLSDKAYTAEAMERTPRWAVRSLKAHHNSKQALYGIIQGGAYQDLRMQSVRYLSKLEFPGFAVGGSLGNTKKDMYTILDWVVPHLPLKKPRHLLGIGTLEDIIEGVKRGIDTFDCVSPTREARNGTLYILKKANLSHMLATTRAARAQTLYSRISITNAPYRADTKPLDLHCPCYTCTHVSRSYMHHLYRAKEMLGLRLGTIHNLYVMNEFMRRIRTAIAQSGQRRVQ